MMKEVRIYTSRLCPYSSAAKTLLTRKKIPYVEIDIAGSWERRDEMIEAAKGETTVPQIFIGATHVGGFDKLQQLERSGQLDRFLTIPDEA